MDFFQTLCVAMFNDELSQLTACKTVSKMISSQIALTLALCCIISSNVNRKNDTTSMWSTTFSCFGEGELEALLDVGDALGTMLKEVYPVARRTRSHNFTMKSPLWKPTN